PKGTKGAKYQSLLNRYKDRVDVYEFTEDSAKFLILQCRSQPSREAFHIASDLIDNLPPYDPPIAPYDDDYEISSAESRGLKGSKKDFMLEVDMKRMEQLKKQMREELSITLKKEIEEQMKSKLEGKLRTEVEAKIKEELKRKKELAKLHEPYEGTDSFIFCSYSHFDKEDVLKIVAFLQSEGFNVWYDKGISTGADWHNTIADKIENCDVFMVCLSSNCIENEKGKRSMVQNEIFLSIDELHKEFVFPIMLEDFKIPGGLRLALAPYQRLHRFALEEEEFLSRLKSELSTMLH
ncbi:MAG: TIR domain-containing protein, partial [Candidatus Lokiarchaeota archaeon]|nr:TIR domain-containing protein [Candidatus Lokiarchaeota archaeon]